MADNRMKEIATKEEEQVAVTQVQTRPGRYYVPNVNICEFEESLKLWADMPGVNEKDIEITLKSGL
jgi:HSP20 family molecular chaperone IbpA